MPTRKPPVIYAPRIAAAHRQSRIEALSRDMLIAAISSTGVGVPTGDDIRQIVRNARTFYSEIDHPTKPKPAKRASGGDGDDEGVTGDESDEGLREGAEVVEEDEL